MATKKKKAEPVKTLSDKERVLEIHENAECKRDMKKGYWIQVKEGKKVNRLFQGYMISDETAWKLALHKLL